MHPGFFHLLMHLKFLHIFPWFKSLFLFSTEQYSIVRMDPCLSTHLLKDILVVSKFGRL